MGERDTSLIVAPPQKTALAMDAASAATAALARAEVEAAYTVALSRPRNLDAARLKILDHCKRPGFAAGALYAVPRGGSTITGPSIRFAEAAAQALGNLRQTQQVIFEDEDRRIVRFTVADLEANLSYSHEATVGKTVERRKVGPKDEVVAERTNSQGQRLFIVRATEADTAQKEGAAASRAIRNAILRLLPRDLLDEAMDAVQTTMRAGGTDPAAARKKLCDAFAGIGVRPEELARYLGQPLDSISPAQLDELRGIYTAIKDGQTTWRDVLEEAAAPEGPATPAPTRSAQVREALAAKAPTRAQTVTLETAPNAAPPRQDEEDRPIATTTTPAVLAPTKTVGSAATVSGTLAEDAAPPRQDEAVPPPPPPETPPPQTVLTQDDEGKQTRRPCPDAAHMMALDKRLATGPATQEEAASILDVPVGELPGLTVVGGFVIDPDGRVISRPWWCDHVPQGAADAPQKTPRRRRTTQEPKQ